MSNFQSFRLNGVARIEKTHTNTHTHTQTYIHTHKHTYTHTNILSSRN